MQSVANLVNLSNLSRNGLARNSSSSATDNFFQPKIKTINSQLQARVNGFYVEMTKLYGHAWVNLYGSSDDGTWYETFEKLTNNELKAGWHALKNGKEEFSTFPPKPLEFRKLCKDAFADEQNPNIIETALQKYRTQIEENLRFALLSRNSPDQKTFEASITDIHRLVDEIAEKMRRRND